MAFNVEVPLEWFEAGASGTCRLASAVVPMGWRSAVAVCQECYRSMLRAAWEMPRRVAAPGKGGGLNPEGKNKCLALIEKEQDTFKEWDDFCRNEANLYDYTQVHSRQAAVRETPAAVTFAGAAACSQESLICVS